MIAELTLHLVKPASGGGGDKYNIDDGFDIYIPQVFSRVGKLPRRTISLEIYPSLTLEEQSEEDSENFLRVECKLEKPAKKGGGDRYQGVIEGENFTVYLPQTYSRISGKTRPAFEFVLKVPEKIVEVEPANILEGKRKLESTPKTESSKSMRIKSEAESKTTEN